jgi:hypothetical protein
VSHSDHGPLIVRCDATGRPHAGEVERVAYCQHISRCETCGWSREEGRATYCAQGARLFNVWRRLMPYSGKLAPEETSETSR